MLLPNKKYFRKNIATVREQDPAEFGRFIMALRNLEDSDDWPRICGIHGNTFKLNDSGVLCPTDPKIVAKLANTGEPFYCAHSVEPFIVWHVPYLYEFENLINKYNRSINQTYIALPYFDICQQNIDYSFMNHCFINIIYDDKEIVLENPLASAYYYPNGVKTKIQRNGFLNANTTNDEKRVSTIRRQLYDTLHAETYEEFSSQLVTLQKTYKPYGYVPLETPHNSIHDIIGGDGGNMSDISISAFDPIFWLHHCNMDRFFYNWIHNVAKKNNRDYSVIFTQKSWNATLAPFSNSNIFGWQNNTCDFAEVKDIVLALDTYNYTYAPVILKKIATENAYIDLVDIPIPQESMTINAYLYPKSLEMLTEENKYVWFAGSVSWFGIDRRVRKCERCNAGITNLKIDVLDFVREHRDVLQDYCFLIEGKGKMIKNADGSYKTYSMDQIVKDGSLLMNI